MLSTENQVSQQLDQKRSKLEELLASYREIMVAFSGGVDSTFLLKFAADFRDCHVLAVVGDSPSLPRRELDFAVSFLKQHHINYEIIFPNELADKNYQKNPSNRCYFCKSHLFTAMQQLARQRNITYIADGTNVDDLKTHRPGKKAANELQIKSPLAEAGFRKQDIRDLSRIMGLPTWQKPAMACLASRFAYGESINQEELARVEKAEAYLFGLGFKELRVRYHDKGKLARIELAANEIERICDFTLRQKIQKKLKELGFIYVTVDLLGYRSGSLNEV